MVFKFLPQQHVRILLLDCNGRVSRAMLDGGPQPIYSVHYIMNGEGKSLEFYEDELSSEVV